MADFDDADPDPGLDAPDVIAKYQDAGKITNAVLAKVSAEVKEGASVVDLCKLGDDTITKDTYGVYTKKVEGQHIPKGIAFPTCISVNNTICHFSPLASEAAVILKNGDVVKIELGAHIDGFAAFAATTVVVGASKDAVVTGKHADAVLAAHTALEVALRLVKPGNTNVQVTEAIQKVATSFSTKPIEGMLSYQIKRFQLSGDKSIILNPNESTIHSPCTFEANEVYSIDVLLSTGSGKNREGDRRPTVFKRSMTDYQFKMKASRNFITEVNKKFPFYPFSLRACEKESEARLGVAEALSHRVVEPFPVLYEREGEVVAQFKSVILLTATGTTRITNTNFDASLFKSEHAVQDDAINALLAQPLGKSKKKEKPAKAVLLAEGSS